MSVSPSPSRLARLARLLIPRQRPEKLDPPAFVTVHELPAADARRVDLVAGHVAQFMVDDPALEQTAAGLLRRSPFVTFESAALAAYGLAADPSGPGLLDASQAQSDLLFHLVAPAARPTGEHVEVFAGVTPRGSWSMVLPTPAGPRTVRETGAVL